MFHQTRILFKTRSICRFCPIDIQMVGVHTRYYRHIRCQMMKRTVKLIRLNHYHITFFIQQQVRAIIIRYPTQKRIRARVRTI